MFWTKITLVVIIVFILLLLFIYWLFHTSSDYVAPNPEEESLKHLKWFLGMDFSDDYTIIAFKPESGPDRAWKLSIILSDDAMEKVKAFLNETNLGDDVTFSDDKKIKYTYSWIKSEPFYIKGYTSAHLEGDDYYTFFMANLKIDFDNKVLEYSETGI
jgi:hypothetical protein